MGQYIIMKTIKKPLSSAPEIISRYFGTYWIPVYSLNKSTRKFRKGEEVIMSGVQLNEIGFVLSGKLKICTDWGTEKEHISRLVSEGDIIGFRAYGNNMLFSCSAVAITECEVEFLPIELFEEMLTSNNGFCYYFMTLIAKELNRSEKQRRDFSKIGTKQRIIYTILYNLDAFGYAEKNKKLLACTLSRKDYASIAGTAYETVVRTLADLEEEKLIRIENKTILILDEPALRRMVRTKMSDSSILQ